MAATLDLTPAELNIRVQTGSRASASITFKDSAGTGLVLTGYLARMQVRKKVDSADVILDLDTDTDGLSWTDAATGVLALAIPADEIPPAGSYAYGLELVPPDTPSGYDETLAVAYLYGSFYVKPEATRAVTP